MNIFTNDVFQEKPPSDQLQLLKFMIGRRIEKIIRCSWDSYENFDPYLLYDISKHDFFRFTSGAIVFRLTNGLEIGFSSSEELNSIIVWCELNLNRQKHAEYYKDDPELFPIDIGNERYTTIHERNFLNRTIDKINIVVHKKLGAKYHGLMNEVGLEFITEDNKSMILGHNLIPSSDSFAILYKHEISQEIIDFLEFREV